MNAVANSTPEGITVEFLTTLNAKELNDYLRDLPVSAVADIYKTVSIMKATADDEAASLGKLWDNMRKRVLPEMMSDMGVSSLRLTGIGMLSLATDAYCSVRAGRKEDLLEWLEDNGHGELKTVTVNSSTLKAFIKEQMMEGGDVPPDDIVSFEPYTYAKLTKA